MKIDFRLATTTGPKRCDPVLVPSGVNQFDALQEMVAAYACPDSVVLDVGAGHGDRDYPTRLKSIVGRIVGVDPSAARRVALHHLRRCGHHGHTIVRCATQMVTGSTSRVASLMASSVAAEDPLRDPRVRVDQTSPRVAAATHARVAWLSR